MIRLLFLLVFVLVALESQAQKKLKVSLSTGHPIHIIEPGGPVIPELLIDNPDATPLRLVVELKYSSFNGKKSQQQSQVEVPAGGQAKLGLKAPFDELGVWNVDYTISGQEGGAKTSGMLSFAIMSPAGNHVKNRQFIFSMCSHPLRADAEQQKLEALAAALIGVTHMRVDGNWASFQPRAGLWRFERFDQMLEIFTAQGISLMPVLSNVPEWAVAKDAKPVYTDRKAHPRNMLPEINAWLEFVRTVVGRYKGKISYFEIWNEPDLHFANFTYDEYLKLLRLSYAAAKEANLEVKIFNGGLSSVAEVPFKGNCLGRTLKEGADDFDILAIHAHSVQDAYRQKLAKMFQQIKRENFTKPWFSHETGLTSIGGQERLQALTLYKKFIHTWALGAMGYSWYDLRNDGYDQYNREHNFGLLTRDFHPKPAYAAYNTISRLFAAANFKHTLLDDGKNYSYLFETPDGFLIAGWAETGSFPLFATTDADSAEIIDLMGNSSPLEINDGNVVIPHTEQPATIRLKQAKSFVPGGNLIALDGIPLFTGSRDSSLRLDLFNPFKSTQEFRFKVGDKVHSAKLASGEKKKITLPLPGRLCRDKLLKIDYKLRESGLRGCLEVPLARAASISAAPHAKPDFILDNASQRHELHPDNPHMLHMTWKGPADISAAIRLSLSGDNLVFDAEVDDDRHCQNHMDGEIWQGDSIQTALVFPRQAGAWELGFALSPTQTPVTHIWNLPADKTLDKKDIRLEVSRRGTKTVYKALIPMTALGIDREDLRKGFRFNVIVNDNDGDGRKGWMQLAPGLGNKVRGSDEYPVITME